MARLPKHIARIPRTLLIGCVRAYQYVLAPHLPASCRYTPTCSEYAVEALETYGAAKGCVLAAHRLLRCHPWGGRGFDPPRWYGETDRLDGSSLRTGSPADGKLLRSEEGAAAATSESRQEAAATSEDPRENETTERVREVKRNERSTGTTSGRLA